MTSTQIDALISSYLTALSTDATAQAAGTRGPSYFDKGRGISWNEWRNGILDAIKSLQELKMMLDPYEVRTQCK